MIELQIALTARKLKHLWFPFLKYFNTEEEIDHFLALLTRFYLEGYEEARRLNDRYLLEGWNKKERSWKEFIAQEKKKLMEMLEKEEFTSSNGEEAI